MTKKLKIMLGSFAGLAVLGGAAAGLGVALSQNTKSTTLETSTLENKEETVVDNTQPSTDSSNNNQTNADSSTNEEVSKPEQTPSFDNLGENVSTLSVRASFDQETDQYTLRIENNESDKGKVSFITKESVEEAIESKDVKDENLTTEITAKPGETIYVGAVANDGYALKNLKVYGSNPNIMLGVVQMVQTENSGIYAFTIPEDDMDDENGFEADKVATPLADLINQGLIHVVASFTKAEVSGWTYNFNYRSYVLDITKDTILDDSNPMFNLLNRTDDELGTEFHDTVNYIIFLNGYNVQVGTFTIPRGITVTLINNRTNTNTNNKENGDSANTITLAKDKSAEHGNEGFRVAGVLAQYSSVKVDAPINGYGVPNSKA